MGHRWRIQPIRLLLADSAVRSQIKCDARGRARTRLARSGIAARPQSRTRRKRMGRTVGHNVT